MKTTTLNLDSDDDVDYNVAYGDGDDEDDDDGDDDDDDDDDVGKEEGKVNVTAGQNLQLWAFARLVAVTEPRKERNNFIVHDDDGESDGGDDEGCFVVDGKSCVSFSYGQLLFGMEYTEGSGVLTTS